MSAVDKAYLIAAKIKYVQIYTCSVCGLEAIGGTVNKEYRSSGAEYLQKSLQIDINDLKANDMPIYWASFGDSKGNIIFRCMDCK